MTARINVNAQPTPQMSDFNANSKAPTNILADESGNAILDENLNPITVE